MLSLAIVLSVNVIAAPARVGQSEARALGELVTVSVSRHKQSFDVLSSQDLRRVVELEADKATMGCTDAGSCLAELAGAMGARYVVFGQLSNLGEQIVLTLNLFDSNKGSSSGRVVIIGARVDDIFPHIDARIDELVKDAAASVPEGTRVRVLVLDLEVPPETPAGAATPVVEPSQPVHGSLWMLLGGGAVAAVGGAAAATGAYFGMTANEAHDDALSSTIQTDRASALTRRDESALTANVLYGTGALLAVGGAALAAASLLVGGEP